LSVTRARVCGRWIRKGCQVGWGEETRAQTARPGPPGARGAVWGRVVAPGITAGPVRWSLSAWSGRAPNLVRRRNRV